MKTSLLDIDGFEIELQRKRVRNLNLRVLRPDGRIRISAPYFTSNQDISQFVRENRAWIEKTRAQIASLPLTVSPQYQDGDRIHFLGQQYPLRVSSGGRSSLAFDGDSVNLRCRANASVSAREKILYQWYASELEARLPDVFRQWQQTIGVAIQHWHLRRMKSKWGSCNIVDKKILLNTELIKYPFECIEYVVVHELVHLLERGHNARFYAFMSRYLPDWKARKSKLNGIAKFIDVD